MPASGARHEPGMDAAEKVFSMARLGQARIIRAKLPALSE
jgi:hypothetical protein